MTEFDPILSSPAAFSVFYHVAVLALVSYGSFVSWVRSAPRRQEARRLVRLARLTRR